MRDLYNTLSSSLGTRPHRPAKCTKQIWQQHFCTLLTYATTWQGITLSWVLKKQTHPSKQAVAGTGLNQYLHKLSQLFQVAGMYRLSLPSSELAALGSLCAYRQEQSAYPPAYSSSQSEPTMRSHYLP